MCVVVMIDGDWGQYSKALRCRPMAMDMDQYSPIHHERTTSSLDAVDIFRGRARPTKANKTEPSQAEPKPHPEK